MSAGNYGKAFAYAAQQLGLPATVVMPDNAPVSRARIIEVYAWCYLNYYTVSIADT